MTFIWPDMLLSLILIPLLVTLYLRIQQRRRMTAQRFGSLWLGGQGAPDDQQVGLAPGWRRHVPPVLFLAGLAILLVGLARPQATITLPRVEGTVILAFDVSDSMAATDVQPSRLEAAKAAARDFVEKQPFSVNIGVVAFSDSAFSVQAPTNDQAAILAAIDRLKPTKGTSLATGIQVALNSIANMNAIPTPQYYSNQTPAPTPSPTPVPAGTYGPAVIVMLTDGENNINPDPLLAAQAAADQGVRIYPVGIGSPGGATLKIDGFSVHTQMDEALLKQIAEVTDGTYYNSQSVQDLAKVYSDIAEQLVIRPEKTEVTAIFAGAGVLVLLVGGVLALLWFGRLP